MSTPTLKTHPLLKALDGAVINLPTPARITSFWNYGSILGLCLIVQIGTGLFLAIQYSSNRTTAFEILTQITADINYGWWLRTCHANGASLFFFAIYCHIGRGIYYGRATAAPVWVRGSLILILLMAAAFLGYVLPWGQISFWGATVITNLISAVPYVGQAVVYWLWGGFSVGGRTLTRFFTLHFLLPFALLAVVIGHLLALHEKGSSNPLGLNSNLDKIPFHPYFRAKDLVGWVVALLLLFFVALLIPWALGDSENFLIADPIVTPVHIKPEWYFLFAYAILRSIPNKLGGVVALLLSVSVLFVLPLTTSVFSHNTPIRAVLFYLLLATFVVLTWIGGKPVEDPYVILGQVASVAYFVLIIGHSIA